MNLLATNIFLPELTEVSVPLGPDCHYIKKRVL